MSAVVNDRDVLLQAAVTRFVPPVISQSQVDGLETRLGDIEGDVGALEITVNSLLNSSRDFSIRASALTFVGGTGATSPATITLTAVKQGGISGSVTWSVFAGSATFSPGTGDSTVVTGSTVAGSSVTLRARITMGGVNYDAFVTLTRLGALSAEDKVNLTSQVTGSLASGNVSGLGALALLNTVNLSTQTTGSLNGLTQVTNLGSLAYASSIAANQIGAGTLAAGVVYAGTVDAEKINAGSFSGKTFTGGAFTGGSFTSEHTDTTRVVLGGLSSGAGRLEVLGKSGANWRRNVYFTGEWGGNVINIHGRPAGYPLKAALKLQSPGTTGTPTLDVDGTVRIQAGSNVYPPFRIVSNSSLPSDRSPGALCFYGGWLCFANGSHWFQSDGTQLT